MEVVMGALPSVITKLGELLVGEYNLQKRVKGEIRFLQSELESMQGALQKISNTPTDQVDIQDKIWARDLRELSFDIEDCIDTFVVRCKGSEPAKHHGFKKVINWSLDSLLQPMTRRKIAMEIGEIRARVMEVCERRDRYKIDTSVAKSVAVDPRILTRYKNQAELVGIDEAREELIIKVLSENNKTSRQEDKTVSLVGFGGLGKTTLARAVYEKLRPQFDCSAFVSVSQNPDIKKVFQDMFYQLAKKNNPTIDVIDEIREFLQSKRYFVIIDDIWDILTWKMITCALPDDNDGYRIITTTRISDVAEQVGGAYKLKPLSLHNSRILLWTRIFGNESKGKCSDEQLASVSEKILRKCAGVPLAIITIANLLISKGRNKIEWFKVFKSIGTGLENNLDVENMRKILSLSYYDLPSHLRTCLLHLSAFPQDYHIKKSRLIWLWMAEGFIQSNRQGKRLFDIGESYYYELMNRGLIQPVHIWYDSETEYCCVHDMVLDLICSLSNEENFVTILNHVDSTSPSKKVRRLSLQNSKVDHATRSMAQVRSVIVFPSAVNLTLFLPSFTVLRVLDLQDCWISQGCSLKYLGNLLQLRYLGLKHTSIAKLPEEIGNLQFLQTLDVTENTITSLPSTIFQLKQLMCLRIDMYTAVATGIGSLTSLEELSVLCISSSTGTIEDLGHLTELRTIGIVCDTDRSNSLEKSLVKCLNKLQRIQRLYINLSGECYLDAWVAPRHLYEFDAEPGLKRSWFPRLPAWVNPSVLLDLSSLAIAVNEIQQKDLETLGSLPALRKLFMVVHRENNLLVHGSLVVGAHLFPCLVQCLLQGCIQPLEFQQGAMPKLATLLLSHGSWEEVRKAADCSGSFHLDLMNLPSLQNVTIDLQGHGSRCHAEKVKAALRHLAVIHPNHPSIEVQGWDGF